MPRSPTRVHCDNAIAPETAAKRSPKDRSEELGGVPSPVNRQRQFHDQQALARIWGDVTTDPFVESSLCFPEFSAAPTRRLPKLAQCQSGQRGPAWSPASRCREQTCSAPPPNTNASRRGDRPEAAPTRS